MKINARLNNKDIEGAILKLEWYKSHLQWKVEQFVSELAEVGIKVAKANTFVEMDEIYKDMGDSLVFTKDVSGDVDGATCILMVEGQPYEKAWQNGRAIVNPLLMAEFGSGWRAMPGHQGTFPGQKYAFRRPWFWIDTSGQKHSSYGSEPSRPLFKAVEEMRSQILTVAERVFGTGQHT